MPFDNRDKPSKYIRDKPSKEVEMNTADLIEQAKTYSGHTGRTLSTIGSYAVRDGKFFDRLGRGGNCTLKTAQRIVSWFDENWPADLEWPSDIPRPSEVKPKSRRVA